MEIRTRSTSHLGHCLFAICPKWRTKNGSG